MQLVNDANGEPLPPIKCTVCGLALYATDWGSYEVTYHCSSAEARFWDFDRGTPDQAKAKEHWDKSKQEVLVDRAQEKKLDATG
ncbi:MAG TPA: hypothetical protein VF939_09500 [Puia sp.]